MAFHDGNRNSNYGFPFAYRESEWGVPLREDTSREAASSKPLQRTPMISSVGCIGANRANIPNSLCFAEQLQQQNPQFIARQTADCLDSFSGAAQALVAMRQAFPTGNSSVQENMNAVQERDPLDAVTTTVCPPSLQERCIPPATLPLVTECARKKSNTDAPTAHISILKSDEQGRKRILLQLEEALRSIPAERKQAYLESLEFCGEKTAVLYFQFLRRTDFNVWESAERVVRYWQRRKELFGERAFLPITLTGEGALTAEDVLTLKAGYPAVLPSTKSGQKVLFFDRSQWIPQATHENKLRCIFYLLQTMADQDEKTQTNGVLFLIVCNFPKWRECNVEYNNLALNLAENIMPVRPIYHLLNFQISPFRRYRFQDLLHHTIGCVFKQKLKEENVFVHFEREQGELLDALLDLGLTREGIPTVVGGCFLYTRCAQWCRDQYFIESRRRKRQTFLETNGSTSETRKFSTASLSGPKGQPLPDQEEKKRKVREMNLINSRRKRERRRAELQDTKDERDELLGEQESLLVEHARLSNLLDQANQIIRTLSLKDDTRYD